MDMTGIIVMEAVITPVRDGIVPSTEGTEAEQLPTIGGRMTGIRQIKARRNVFGIRSHETHEIWYITVHHMMDERKVSRKAGSRICFMINDTSYI